MVEFSCQSNFEIFDYGAEFDNCKQNVAFCELFGDLNCSGTEEFKKSMRGSRGILVDKWAHRKWISIFERNAKFQDRDILQLFIQEKRILMRSRRFKSSRRYSFGTKIQCGFG